MPGQRPQEAGVVGEVLPPDALLPRAWTLARQWAAMPQLTLLGTRSILTADWKRKLADHLHTGLTYEAMADLSRPQQPATTQIVDLLGTQ